MPGSGQYKKTVLYLAAAMLIFLLLLAGWGFLRRTVGRAVGDFCYPYLRASRTGFDKLSDQTLLVFSRRELASQLEMLRSENVRLAAQAAAASELLLENSRLRRMLAMPAPAGWRHIPCEIVLRDPRLWHEQFTVDRGSVHGVRIGAAAMTFGPEGQPVFVGIVSGVSRHTATVITVFNPSLRMSAILPKSGASGILHTGSLPESGGMLPVGFLPIRNPYTLGEVLQTSGFERNIPSGLRIGNLGDVQSVDSLFSGELYLSGRFVPAVNLGEARFLILAVRQDAPREDDL